MTRMKFYLLLGCTKHKHCLMSKEEPDGKEICWMPMDGNYLWNLGTELTRGCYKGNQCLQSGAVRMTFNPGLQDGIGFVS